MRTRKKNVAQYKKLLWNWRFKEMKKTLIRLKGLNYL